jgi:hypothetical protein
MRLVAKTMGKVVLEITTKQIEENGFDYHWDKMRRVYTAEEYDVDSIKPSVENSQIIFVELILKKQNN